MDKLTLAAEMNSIRVLLGVLLVGLAGCQVPKAQQLDQEEGEASGAAALSELPEEDTYLDSVPEEFRRLTVPYLRALEYPGSEIRIEAQLAETSNYTSYLASYVSEGLKIYGLLMRPSTAPPEGGFPAVVFLHGYVPPLEYQTTEKYEAYVDRLADSGLVVFKIDYRGHGSSEGEPGGAYYSGDYVIDALNAYESLKRLEYVNRNRIGLWGHSMSGNVVLRAMAVKPEIPAGVIWGGAVYTYLDMAEYRISDASYEPSQNPNRNRRQELFNTVGAVAADNPFWSRVMATNYIGESSGRVEIHHASNDPVVPIEYSRNLGRILEDLNVAHQVYEYSNGGHNLESPAFIQAMQRSIATFQQM